jgi:hypothetical protein
MKVVNTIRIATVCVAISVTLFAETASSGFLSRKLPHGFRLVHRTVDLSKCTNCFEGMGHYQDLYYRKARVADTVGQVSISPSGRFAVFERMGKLLLFDLKTKKTRDVTDGSFSVPQEFRWREEDNVVVVNYYKDHGPSEIALGKAK